MRVNGWIRDRELLSSRTEGSIQLDQQDYQTLQLWCKITTDKIHGDGRGSVPIENFNYGHWKFNFIQFHMSQNSILLKRLKM